MKTMPLIPNKLTRRLALSSLHGFLMFLCAEYVEMARRADKAERPARRVVLLAAQGELRPKVDHTFSYFLDLWLITARDPYVQSG